MKQQYAALADLVGQLLAQRWIQEFDQDRRNARPNAERPTSHLAEPPSHNLDDEKDV